MIPEKLSKCCYGLPLSQPDQVQLSPSKAEVVEERRTQVVPSGPEVAVCVVVAHALLPWFLFPGPTPGRVRPRRARAG